MTIKFLYPAFTTLYEFEPPHFRGFEITHKDAPQSVGLLWTSDQPVAETRGGYMWQAREGRKFRAGFNENLEEKITQTRHIRKKEDNIKMDLKDI
jgi:hypothetical protein